MNFIHSKKSKVTAVLLSLFMLLTCFTVLQTDSVHAATKAPYSSGDNINNAVFYIAVDADGDGSVTGTGDAVYYYTRAEIEAVGEQVAYHYGNHGEGETATVKGAKLKTLMDATTGIAWNNNWTVQYMEEDAYHATGASYQDTIQGLTDENGVGNGSGAGVAAETIIGYACKTTYDKPDANNVDEKTFTDFVNYEREASDVRVYRQTSSANSSIMKMLKGVVISPVPAQYTGEVGYTLKHTDNSGAKIADDYEVMGFVTGMKWPAAARPLAWAKLTSASPQVITIGSDTTQAITYKYDETPFFAYTKNGVTKNMTRTQLAQGSVEMPGATNGGITYTYYGYNKPMYVRYQGAWLDKLLGTVSSGDKVYLVKADGTTIDITSRVGDFFVAYYYSQSKKSTNISNSKRVPLNYDTATVVDSKSAPVEYSNNDTDYTVASGKEATIYEGAKIVVGNVNAVTGLKAARKTYKSNKISWTKVSGAQGYQVYRSTKKTSGYKLVKTVSATSFTNTGLKTGTQYYYKVRAYKTIAGQKLYGGFSTVKSAKPYLSVPTAKAAKSGKTAIKISWNNIKGESGYKVYRAQKKTGKYTAVGKKNGGKTVFTDKKVKKGKTYYYKVRAFKNVNGKKVYSAPSKIKKIKR